MSEESVILFCRCANRGILPDDVKSAVLAGLRARSLAFTEAGDLCGLAAASDASLRGLAEAGRKVTVVACHPRAVKWLLRAAGLPLPEDHLQVLDMRTLTAAAILEQLPAAGRAAAMPLPPANGAGEEWQPWYPVIDYDRCRQCRQCVSFCLFGVYELLPDGTAKVANPQNCKNNCPACARICPEAAIIFPKLDESEAPLNGADIENEAEFKARARINVQEILGDDVYKALAERRRRAGARRLVRPAREQAEEERAACLAKSQAAGGETTLTAEASSISPGI